MENDGGLLQHASDSADPTDPPGQPDAQLAPDTLDPSAATPRISAYFDAFDEPATPSHALPVPAAAPEQPAPPIRQRNRRGLCLYTFVGAAAIALLVCAGVGVVALRTTLANASAARVRANAEANRLAILSRTPVGTATALPGATFPPLPNAVIAFGGGTASTTTRQCNGPAPLDPVTLVLDNSHSTISVDWWIQITDTAPGGTLLWASGAPPYGTLRAGQSVSVEVDLDPTLCAALVSTASPVTYHATVFYGGVGGFTVSVVVVPPGPAQVAAAPASA